jgi:hypothetical protein
VVTDALRLWKESEGISQFKGNNYNNNNNNNNNNKSPLMMNRG